MEYLLKTLDIELTAHCNFMCEFCPYPDITRTKGQMDFALAMQVLDEVAEKKICNNIGISQMGEPLLYNRLPEVVGYAQKKGLKIHVITNGSLLTEEKVVALYENNLDKLLISYHTPDKMSFESIRKNSRINFAEYENRIFNAIKLRIEGNYATKIIMNFMFSGDVPFKIPRCIDSFRDLENAMRKWVLRLKEISSKIDEQMLHNFIKDLKKNIDYYNYLEILPGVKFSVGLVYRWANWLLKKQGIDVIPKQKGFCNMPFERIMILWNGDVTYCCGDYDGKLVIGNIKKESLENIYKKRLREVRNEFKEGVLVNELCQVCKGKIKILTALQAFDYSHVFKDMLFNPSVLRLLLYRLKKRSFLIKK